MAHKKVGVIVQARMGSTRLPGKVLKNLDDNETVLSLLIKRLKLSKQADIIVIATSDDEANKLIVELAKDLDIPYFLGSEHNVLERYYQAAKKYRIRIIVRITADCPFIDSFHLDDMILYFKNHNYDYIKNVDEKSNVPVGFDTEIFTFDVLEEMFSLAETSVEKEHVTYYMNSNPKDFTAKIYNLKNIKKNDDLWLTIDEKEDLEICREVFKKIKEKNLSIDFTMYDVIKLIEEKPEIMDINKKIYRKLI